MKEYKQAALIFSGLLLIMVVFYFVGEILLPFFVGLLLAYAIFPSIKKIQKYIPNYNLAVTSFLTTVVIGFLGITFLFGSSIVNDFSRLNNAFQTFVGNNSGTIDESTGQIKEYIEKIYSVEEIEKELENISVSDSLENLDFETIEESFSKIVSFFGSGDETKEAKSQSSTNGFLILIYSLGYFIYTLFTYDYFDKGFKKYFGEGHFLNKTVTQLLKDFDRSFLTYFKQRSKVVLICTLIFMLTFFILGVPGAFILAVIGGVLCYIANFHYFTLIPLSLSCWALSIEQNHSFFLYFGIIVGVFILISILEEVWFFPYIMEGVSSMNPAVMVVSFSLWPYVFGTTIGLLIALPLTTMLLIYFDRILLYAKEYFEDDE